MSENFLSFVTNAAPKTLEASADVSSAPGPKSPQGADFASILKKEQALPGDAVGANKNIEGDLTAVVTKVLGPESQESDETGMTTPKPVELPVLPSSGNALPELSIHSRALQVGRVILTTANPKVSEESLNQFAQSQATEGAQISGPTGASLQTQSILQGLMGQQAPASATMAPGLAGQMTTAPGANASELRPLGRSPLQQFGDWQQYTRSGTLTNPAVDPEVAPENGNGLGTTHMTRGQAAQEASLLNEARLTKAGPQVADSGAKAAPLPMTSADLAAEPSVDTLMSLDAGSDQPDLPQGSGSTAIPTVANAGHQALAPSSVTTPTTGLAEALMSSERGQMQSRLQPYQAWTQRFGEVLAQKLAVAVKDGNWSVKLNLNPASLGPVGVELQVSNNGIEGQIAANDANVRQLLNDSLPRLRQSLEALVGDHAGVNIELGDQRDSGAKAQQDPDFEIPIDLLAEEFVPLEEAIANGNILRDGLNVFV